MRLIVIGGGAAGFFCAVNAARMNPSLEVIIVEKSAKLLSKVRISGGGRCNVTHACFSIPDMVKKYPRGGNFVKKTFHAFFTTDTIEWFADRGVRLKTEADGRMFPVTDSSESIVQTLVGEAIKYNVKIRTRCGVKKIRRNGEKWIVEYAELDKEQVNVGAKVDMKGKSKGNISGEVDVQDKREEDVAQEADFICVACGGFPKTSMFDWLVELGHTIEPPVPSLFTFNMLGNSITTLMGIALQAKVKIQGSKLEEEGPVLITHWGLSGPAVLKLSARGARELNEMNYRFTVIVNWCPGHGEQSLNEKISELRGSSGAQRVWGKNMFGLPQRLWEHLCEVGGIDERMRWADLPAVKQRLLVQILSAHEMKVEGKTTYKEEFVTAGGIKLSEIDHNTMESRKCKRLYFAGEILDVDGVTGGFNFQHAWTSGWIAANAIVSASLAAQ